MSCTNIKVDTHLTIIFEIESSFYDKLHSVIMETAKYLW